MEQPTRTRRWQNAVWWGLPALCFFMLAILRWERFGDVQVDFGQDIAAAWSITEGKHLYTDIAYFKGPFSPHWNALLMMIFGVSIRTITVANMGVVLGVAYGIAHLVRRACGIAVSSTLACIFLFSFAFTIDRKSNIFNFITPFVHELPHGIALSLLTILSLERWTKTNSIWMMLIGGIFFGLAWLTRVEVAVALTAACAAWFWCMGISGIPPRSLIRSSTIFFSGSISIIALAIAALAQSMPWNMAGRSAFASVIALRTSVASSPFFLMLGGWDHPITYAALQLAALLMIIIWMLLFYAAADLWQMKVKTMAFCFAAAGMMMILMLAKRVLPFIHGGFLTISTIGITAAAVFGILRRYKAQTAGNRLTMVIGIFALGMLGKIVLVPSIRFYGFAHAMPAYLLLMGTLLTALPSIVERRLGKEATRNFLLLLSIAILLDIGGKARIDQYLAREKTIAIGTLDDRFFVSDSFSNPSYRDFLLAAPALIPAGSTLTAIPEGAMINNLLRLPLGVPIMNYMRTEYMIFGKDRIEGDLFAHRPDFILVTHKETSDFGYPLYGKMPEYGADVMAWLKREYEQIALFGDQPLTRADSEGVALWRTRDFEETPLQ